ncbi:enoyl-CoA hydratase/isomerase family protein [Rugosimonospora africana]|uniref:Enoyl-CoA hydratase n=1 Tax=Rugosimonospora africana TaxID=556532 RepID=A0A8J3VTP9_9ACTN|nr:enoyl-CoA hydratase/isomerase family protein [Rugosimonospora africana]GIH17758.1 enoyl-CoA hydratase [Rugosimonospora africana]
MTDYDFQQLGVRVAGQVATVELLWPDGRSRDKQAGHHELATCLARVRGDDDIRVLVLKGAVDGTFYAPFVGGEHSAEPSRFKKGVMSDPEHIYRALQETQQIMDSIVRMEKPVIAMVNGNALGLGASLAFACDFIVADERAYITDIHIANHHFVPSANRSTGIVPGDGGTVFWPAQMSLVKAKEYLMTGRPVTARELADLNAITKAVPASELQATVDGYIEELLARPAWALGWTKLAINKRLRSDLELTLDTSAALEALSMRVRDDYPGPKGTQTL